LLALYLARGFCGVFVWALQSMSFACVRALSWGVAMNFKRLGKSGLRVPELSFGTATFGGVSQINNDFR
jgi:hypothetical protein